MDNEFKLEFKSKSINEGFARIVVASFVSQLDPMIEELSDIKIAVSEAVTNSIIHGYPDTEGIVIMELSINDNLLTIKVTDNGIGILDVDKARQPLYTSKPEFERSGMGFTVMESFMDGMTVRSKPGKGTTVILQKVLEARQEA